MDINNYRSAMDVIKIDRLHTPQELYLRMDRRNRTMKRKLIPSTVLLTLVVVACIVHSNISASSSNIVVMVYAAEQEKTLLTEELISINPNAQAYVGSISTDTQGNDYVEKMDYNINFICEGDNIEEITYICADKEITRDTVKSVPAYYVENMKLPVEEYKQLKLYQDDTFLFGFYAPGEELANLTKLIGTSYTVPYEEQNSKEYGLIVNASDDQKDYNRFDDLIITMKIKMKNGTYQYKQIKLILGDDAMSEVQICIL